MKKMEKIIIFCASHPVVERCCWGRYLHPPNAHCLPNPVLVGQAPFGGGGENEKQLLFALNFARIVYKIKKIIFKPFLYTKHVKKVLLCKFFWEYSCLVNSFLKWSNRRVTNDPIPLQTLFFFFFFFWKGMLLPKMGLRMSKKRMVPRSLQKGPRIEQRNQSKNIPWFLDGFFTIVQNLYCTKNTRFPI